MTLVEHCPRCQFIRDHHERFCAYCGQDLMKYDTTCYECGGEIRTGHAIQIDWDKYVAQFEGLRRG